MKTIFKISLILIFTTIHNSLAQKLTLIAGGDVEWSRMVRVPSYYHGSQDQDSKMRDDGWRRISYLATPESKKHVKKEYGLEPDAPTDHHITSIPMGLTFSSPLERDRYPFRKIAAVLRSADIAYLNLETPLSDSARRSGAFLTPSSFASAIKWAGVDFVSTANNHAFDAEGQGLLDTKKALLKKGIPAIGTGTDLEDARKPHIIEQNGIRVAFLAYTYGVNPTNTSMGLVLPNRSGAMPMDPFLIKEDIKRVRKKVDFVGLSLHWGIENEQDIHPAAIAFAHQVLDYGADAILGHHPHVPRGVEVYNGKPIIYSMGNFIFGHGHTNWMDNFLTRLTFSKDRIPKVEILPIAGRLLEVGQPYLLDGARATDLLEDIKKRSKLLKTNVAIVGNIGVVEI